MSEFRKRGLGWTPPSEHVMARIKFAKAQVSSLMFGVDPADVADNAGLVQIVDQGDLGSCVANACAQIIHGEMVRNRYTFVDFPSRMWAYQLALNAQGTEGQDVGTNLATCMDCLAEFGYPPESSMPYDVAGFGKRPSPSAWHDAVDQRAPGGLCYHQIGETGDARVLAIRQALTAGHLVAFGTQVTEEFCSSQPPELVDVPTVGDTYAGGHAMVWCGYSAVPGFPPRYQVANSWGPGFGDGGFFWMSEEYVRWHLTNDIWICTQPPQYSEVQS